MHCTPAFRRHSSALLDPSRPTVPQGRRLAGRLGEGQLAAASTPKTASGFQDLGMSISATILSSPLEVRKQVACIAVTVNPQLVHDEFQNSREARLKEAQWLVARVSRGDPSWETPPPVSLNSLSACTLAGGFLRRHPSPSFGFLIPAVRFPRYLVHCVFLS